jgi:hypothetical protein
MSLQVSEFAGDTPASTVQIFPTVQLIVETEVTCPHCGEVFPLQIDTSQSEQSLIEDCSVCCRPINLIVRCQPGVVVDLVYGES